MKRLGVPPSSTMGSHTPMDLSHTATEKEMGGMTDPRAQPCISALESEMVNKRLALQASVKAALHAQNAIGYHKKKQEQKEKALKELDDVLSRDNALTPDTSPKECGFVEDAKAQALSRVEEADMGENCAAAEVERALYQQKVAIQAAVVATTREQTALVVVQKTLKELENRSGSTSRILTQHAGFSNVEIAFTDAGTTPEQISAQQKPATGVATEASSVGEPASSVNGSSKIFGKQRKGKSCSSSTSDTPKAKISRKCPHPKKIMNLNAVTSGKSQAVSTGEVLPKPIMMHGSMCKDFPQPKAMVGSNAVTSSSTEETSLGKQTSINESSETFGKQRMGKSFSSSTSDTPKAKSSRKSLHPKSIWELNAVTSDESQAVSTGEVLPKSIMMHGNQCKDFPQPEEAVYLIPVTSHEKVVDSTCRIQEKRLPHDCLQPHEVIDLSSVASQENDTTSKYGFQHQRFENYCPQSEGEMDLSVETEGLDNMHISSPFTQ